MPARGRGRRNQEQDPDVEDQQDDHEGDNDEGEDGNADPDYNPDNYDDEEGDSGDEEVIRGGNRRQNRDRRRSIMSVKTILSLVPQLTKETFYEWKLQLEMVEYTDGWNENILRKDDDMGQ